MPEPAIRVENIGKRYRIAGRAQGGYRTLRETLGDAVRAPLRRMGRGTTEDFWALKDVSFEVQPGEVVGIIGRNGAGKSTLLKILSRITTPTTGRIEINGRVGSLLEVGTGFHPELTGRENVYLNGSVLGMSRREIAAKFDEIVAFAEIDQFLDTPVKRYSSGMYVRLAFAVAAHLEPEILIVDEVLAVGDAGFQKKCIDKIKQIGRSGHTVLFVSHNIGTVAALCTAAVRLDAGRVVGAGPAQELVTEYVQATYATFSQPLAERTDRTGTGAARFTRVRLETDAGEPTDTILAGDGLTVLADYTATQDVVKPSINLALFNDHGAAVAFCSSDYSGDVFDRLSRSGTFVCRINQLPLATGRYRVHMCLMSDRVEVDHIAGVAEFEVESGPFYPTGRVPTSEQCVLLCRYDWQSQSRRPVAAS